MLIDLYPNFINKGNILSQPFLCDNDSRKTMLTKSLLDLQAVGYEIKVSNTEYSAEYAVDHIDLPRDSSDIPNIVGWAGPARSGTTSLLFLLASHPQIQRAYFQPLKTILRLGGPRLNLQGLGNSTVCIKEVFRECCKSNGHDPIAILLEAGVPPNKISWIAMLRDPVRTYASWTHHIARSTPSDYISAQLYTIEFYKRYKELGVNIIPLAYDLIEGQESKVINRLFMQLGLDINDSNLIFRSNVIRNKLLFGQAEDINYYNLSIKPIFDHGRFEYMNGPMNIPRTTINIIRNTCQKVYDDFCAESIRQLKI